MAIDKIIPRKLVKDIDERLVQEGDMIDALNVTMSEGGEGTEGVLKNSYGTSAAIGVIETSGDYTVVGRCVDQTNSVVYFFVRDNSSTDHRIIKYKASTHSFTTVLASSVLNFSSDHTVKADVISSNFSGSSTIQSLLYFTDNSNPPRKINVDRALANDYSVLSDADLEKALSVAKPAPQTPIEFAFETDPDVQTNNFRDRYFQFATQLVYTDGEESAISMYSKLAVSDASSYDGLNSAGSAQPANTHNVLRLSLNYSPASGDDRYVPDVKYLRILAKDGNDGVFVKIDEFDPSESITQKIYGSSRTVYDSSAGTYLFYNTKNYGAVDQNTVNKTYDNVPLKAEGQAITNNRLFYSNYEEGRDKISIDSSKVTLSVQYSTDEGFKDVFDNTANIATVSGDDITIDLLAGTSFDDFEPGANLADKDTVVPTGTTINVTFSYDPVGTVSKSDGPVASVDFDHHIAYEYNDDSGIWNAFSDLFTWALGTTDNDAWANTVRKDTITFGDATSSATNSRTLPIGTSVDGAIVVSATVTTATATTVEGIGRQLADKIESVSGQKKWRSRGFGAPEIYGQLGTSTEVQFSASNQVKISTLDFLTPAPSEFDYLSNTSTAYSFATFGHDDITEDATHGYATFTVKPRLTDVDMTQLLEDTTLRPIGQLADSQTEQVSTNPSKGVVSLGSDQAALTYDYSGTQDAQQTSDDITNGFNFSYTAGASSGYSPTVASGFKSGSTYDVGIVYYDEYGRSSFVCELGTSYIKTPAQRVISSLDAFGSANIKVSFASTTPDPPSWAKRYQVVVSENNSYQDFVQYTTGGAYVPVDEPGTSNPTALTTDTKIYVSLKTLDIYNERSDNARDYSFTKGDKLRVLQYDNSPNATETMVIPQAFVNQGGTNTNGHPIEFDITGVETYSSAADNPCCSVDPSSHPAQAKQFEGTFLILSAPQIDAGTGPFGQEKYEGFDFQHVYHAQTGSSIGYPSGTGGTSAYNYWGRKSIVEILTPRKSMGDKFYYEVGESRNLREYKNYTLSNYGPDMVLDGDVWLRPVSLITGKYDSQNSDWDSPFNPGEWSYIVRSLESLKPSEASPSNNWSKGRAHLPFRNEAPRKLQNGITYSDAFVEDSGFLGLSSFNASLANFSSLDSQYGAVRFIDNYDDSLMAIQDERMSFVPVKKNIVEYAGGSSGLVVSTDITGQPTYYSGDYGCGNNPDSVLSVDGKVFFVDPSRLKVMMHSGGQLVPISDTGMASYFLNQLNLAKAAGGVKVASGYDPRTDTYYVTIKPVGSYAGTTVSYNTRFRAWQSTHSFIPDEYATIDGDMLSCKYVTTTVGADSVSAIVHKHDRLVPRNKFYGSSNNSTVRVVSKLNPSLEKCFDALSIEGSKTWASTAITTDSGQTANAHNFVEKEGQMYSSIGGDTSSNSSSQIRSAGLVNGTPSAGASAVTVSNIDLNKSPILGMELYVLSGSALVKASTVETTCVITSISGGQITIDGTLDESVVLDDAKLFAQGSKQVDGDKLRGKYAIIDMSNGSTSATELYCINTHITESKLNHALGQE